MPPQARLGDKALIPADAHGCVACPHTASGPAVAGSPNVNVNGRPAIRVDDPGIHTACCGGNTWNAQTGSKSVFINGKPAHRLGDIVRHCGGVGKCIEGSGNVIVGDIQPTGKTNIVSQSSREYAKLNVWLAVNKLPIKGARILVDALGTKITNQEGNVEFDNIEPGACVVSLENREIWRGQLASGQNKKLRVMLPLLFFGCAMKDFRIS